MIEYIPMMLIVAASIIIIGFLGNYLFEKKGVPDMLFLIFIGIVLGPALNILEPSVVEGFAPYVSAFAMVFILFDGGMKMNVLKVVSSSPRAIFLAASGFLFSMLVVAAFMVFVMGIPWFYGLLFGSIFGGSSSIVVVSLASKIGISEKGSTTLLLESAITDILCIVVSISIIGVILTGNADYVSIGTGIGLKFLIGALAGIALGIFWLFALRKVACLPFCYVLTLGIAILAYAVSETVGGSGALSVLLFGLMLGNETEILESLRYRRAWCTAVDDGLKRFESEIAFFVRTFFFVFLGIIATISSAAFVALGIILTVLLLAARVAAVHLSTIHSELKDERLIMTLVLTRGLAAAVLAILPAQYGLQYAQYFVNFAVVIILSTAVIATAGAIGYARRSNRKKAYRYRK
jgi:Na+:H+ antiporter